MKIDIVFDTICPWCFVGKRRLERALAERPEHDFALQWRPFLLNPDMPEAGISRTVYLERKFGNHTRIKRMLSQLMEAGVKEGIDFNFDAIKVTPNSVDSHRLIQYAASYGLASQALDALYDAYFCQGENIGDRDLLLDIATRLGMEREPCQAMLRGGRGRGEIYLENAFTHRLSINGVPSYIFNESYGIAGAQDSIVLQKLIDVAADQMLEIPASRTTRPL